MAGLTTLTDLTDQVTKLTSDQQFDKTALESRFAAALASAGGAYPDESAYYRLFNQLHRLDYFNPHVTGNLHIFMTRPSLNLNQVNIAMDNRFLAATASLEGSMILASLCEPGGSKLDLSSDEKLTYVANRAIDVTSDSALDWQGDEKGIGDNESNFGALKNAGTTKTINNLEAFSHAANGMTRLKEAVDAMGYTPFIPIISNLSTSISGMKDLNLEKYEYDGDQAGHKTAEAMGLDDSQSSGEFSINLIENSNLGVSMLAYLWLQYMDNTGKGIMNPHMDTVLNLEYDYMSSVYWFVTGADGFSIKLYGKLTGVYPLGVPLTSLIPNERGSFTDPKISLSFHYNHSEIMDPAIIYDFNVLCDTAAYQTNWDNINKGPNVFNSKIAQWYDKVYKPTKGGTDDNIALRKFMATGRDNNKLKYNFSIFEPEAQNAWMGHPYIIDGKLVYRVLNNQSSVTTQSVQRHHEHRTYESAKINSHFGG